MTKKEKYENLLYIPECIISYYMSETEIIQSHMILRLVVKSIVDDNDLNTLEKIELLEYALKLLKCLTQVKEVF